MQSQRSTPVCTQIEADGARLNHRQHSGNTQRVPSHSHEDPLASANGHWQRILCVNLEGDARRLESPIPLRPTDPSQISPVTLDLCPQKCLLA